MKLDWIANVSLRYDRIATLEQAAATTAQTHDYQQHGYYDYSSYYQQANVAGIFLE